MTAAASGIFTYPSKTAASTCTATNATDSSDRFLCSPVTANRGRPGSLPCLVTRRPSSITAVSSSSETTPVARLAYQSTVWELIPLTLISIGHQAKGGIQGGYEAALRNVFALRP